MGLSKLSTRNFDQFLSHTAAPHFSIFHTLNNMKFAVALLAFAALISVSHTEEMEVSEELVMKAMEISEEACDMIGDLMSEDTYDDAYMMIMDMAGDDYRVLITDPDGEVWLDTYSEMELGSGYENTFENASAGMIKESMTSDGMMQEYVAVRCGDMDAPEGVVRVSM